MILVRENRTFFLKIDIYANVVIFQKIKYNPYFKKMLFLSLFFQVTMLERATFAIYQKKVAR